jgi:hypothetical protein
VADGAAVRFEDLTAWCYAGNRRPWRVPIYRALKRYGVPAGQRGWWLPNTELAELISPKRD